MSLSRELAVRGAEVTILDAAEFGSGTTEGTFGWVNANEKEPAEYARLNQLGIEAYERLARSSLGAPWFHQTGGLEVALEETELAALETKVVRAVARDYEAQLLSEDQARKLEPALGATRLAGGAFYPREGWVDTATMCATLLAEAVAKGANFHPFQKVVRLTSTGVETIGAGGVSARHDAELTVLTAGNGIRPILAAQGVEFETIEPNQHGGARAHPYPAAGVISTTAPVTRAPRLVLHADGISLRPARNGGLTLTELATGGRWDPTDERIWTVPGILLERAHALLPGLRTTIESVHIRSRVLPRDGVTISDWITGNVYAIATHSGVTLALHLAEVVSDELLHGHRDDSLTAFGRDRFNSPAPTPSA